MARRTRAKTEETADVAEARRVVGMGVPVFVAHRESTFPYEGTGNTGYRFPSRWQRTEPDADILEDWEPGDALGAICGWTFDVLDADPRNGGDASYEALLHELAGNIPLTYGQVSTPSGGWHNWLAALGVGKHTGFRPGLDLQGGRPDGEGIGFVFIPPTERKSKVDGVVRPYVWDEFLEEPGPDDATGEALARLIVASAGTGGRKTGRPKKATLAGSDRLLAQAELRRYLRDGIGEDEAHDVTLARCVWAWRMRRADREWAYQRWRQIVSRTELTDPGWKFRRRDFDRHWAGADKKRSAQEAHERAGLTVADLETAAGTAAEWLPEDDLDAAAQRVAGWLTEDDLDAVVNRVAGWLS